MLSRGLSFPPSTLTVAIFACSFLPLFFVLPHLLLPFQPSSLLLCLITFGFFGFSSNFDLFSFSCKLFILFYAYQHTLCFLFLRSKIIYLFICNSVVGVFVSFILQPKSFFGASFPFWNLKLFVRLFNLTICSKLKIYCLD